MSDQEGDVTDSFDSKGKGLDFFKKLDKKRLQASLQFH